VVINISEEPAAFIFGKATTQGLGMWHHWGMPNAFNVLVEKWPRDMLLRRPKCRLEDNSLETKSITNINNFSAMSLNSVSDFVSCNGAKIIWSSETTATGSW
jgi:hypothetical protein